LIERLVIDVNQLKYADLIKIGFQILQLISNEFLMNLDTKGLDRFIEVMGVYGSKVQDLNINLGAIGLLWNVADFLQSQSSLKQKDDVWDSKIIDSLYVDLLSQLAKLCQHEHPDVRNGAAHTLFRAFMIHGWTFQPPTLRLSFDQIMYPLMEMITGPCPIIIATVTEDLHQKSEEKAESQKDKDSRLSVHHSKESLQKQWEETQVLVVQGIAKIFEEYMGQLIHFEDILDPWGVYMRFVSSLIQSGSKDVITGTMDAYCNLLNMTNIKSMIDKGQHYLLMPLWKEAFVVWKSMAQQVFVEQVHLHDWTQKIIVSFLCCFRGIYTLLHLELGSSGLQDVFDVFYRCLFVPYTDTFYHDRYLTLVQKTIMDLLEMIELTEERVSIIIHYYLRLCHLPFSYEEPFLHPTHKINEIKSDDHHTFLALSQACIPLIPLILMSYSNNVALYLDDTFQSCIKVI
jgi:hypothetical protein